MGDGSAFRNAFNAAKEGKLTEHSQAALSDLEMHGSDVSYLEEGQVISTSDYVDEDEEQLADSEQEVESEEETTEATEEGETEQGEVQSGDVDEEEFYIENQGTRRKVKVNYKDKAAIKKTAELAAHLHYGMRKYQMERDEERELRKGYEEKFKEHDAKLHRLNKVWEDHGYDGIIRLLSEGKENLDSLVEQRLAKKQRLESADPAERVSMEYEDKLSTRDRELAELRAQIDAIKNSNEETSKRAQQQQDEAMIYPVFSRYAFTEADGEEESVAVINEMLFRKATEALDKYEEAGVPITKQVVEREFRRLKATISRMVKNTAGKEASKKVSKQKKAAQSAASSFVEAKTSNNIKDRDAIEALKRGDFRGFFKKNRS